MYIINFFYNFCNIREKKECVICYEYKYLYKFPTCNNHIFCKNCINRWSEKNLLINNGKKNCPLCRK